MSAAAICVMLLAFFALGLPAALLVVRDEKAKRREWRPAGYTSDSGPDWWTRPLPAIGLAQSVRSIDAPPAAELVSLADPRVIKSTRYLSARTDGVRSAPKRAQRVRRVTKAKRGES